MRFDELDRIRCDSGHTIGVVKTANLSFCLRCIDCVARSVTGCSNSFQDGVNLVAITFGISLSFEDKHADPFAKNRPIRLVRKWPGVPGCRQCGSLAEAHEHEDVIEGVDPSGDNHVAATRPKLQGGKMNGR